MNMQNLINLLDSNMFLVVSYSLIFIFLSSFALKYLAKLFMFFIYIGIFAVAVSFIFSTTPNIKSANISVNKIVSNISKSVSNLGSSVQTSKNYLSGIKNTYDIGKAKSIFNDTSNSIKSVAESANSKIIENGFSINDIISSSVKSDVYSEDTGDNTPVTIVVNPDLE